MLIQNFNAARNAPDLEIYKIGLALQGGGPHGAATKGKLKGLLTSPMAPQISIEAISGVSAGAVNAVLFKYGLLSGGPDEAIRVMDTFWDQVGRDFQTGYTVMQGMKLLNPLHFLSMYANPGKAFPKVQWPNLPANDVEEMQRHLKNLPSGKMNRILIDRLNTHIKDWTVVQSDAMPVYITAMQLKNKSKGFTHSNMKPVVFTGEYLCAETVAASAALALFGPQKYNGKSYYDGGYVKNTNFSVFDNHDIDHVLTSILHRKPDGPVIPMSQDEIVRQSQDKLVDNLIGGEIHFHLEHLRQRGVPYDIWTLSLTPEEHEDQSVYYNAQPKRLRDLSTQGEQIFRDWEKFFAQEMRFRRQYDAAPFDHFDPTVQMPP